MKAVDRLAVSTALLSKLNRNPSLPQIKPLRDNQQRPDMIARRVMSLKHEAIFVEHFAFVCAYSDDPLHVLAVCVEEDYQRAAITIRLTANTGQHEALLEGLKPVTDLLQREACHPNSVSPDHLLQALVCLNRKRILSRIRSEHASSARARQKTPLLRRCMTFHSLFHMIAAAQTAQTSLSQELAVLISQLERLESMETKYVRAGQADDLLHASILQAQILVSSSEADFNLVPCTPPIWRDGETASLLIRLNKFAHYAVACVQLLRIARRYQIFSHIEVVFLDLQQIGPRTSADAGLAIDRIVQGALQITSQQIPEQVHQALPAMQRAVALELSGKSRLHAEIQLAVFFERNPSPLPPRVLCSSKSACYLCDLFLEMQGKYCILSTHGRLYEAWRWPLQNFVAGGVGSHSSRPEFAAILGPFSKVIESKLQQLLRQSQIKRHNDPVESLVDISGMMTPSIMSDNQELIERNSSTILGSVQSVVPSSRVSSTSTHRHPNEHAGSSRQPDVGREELEGRVSPAISGQQVLSQSSDLPHEFSDDRFPIIRHFTHKDRVLEIRAPGLEVELLHIPEGRNPIDSAMSLSVEVIHRDEFDTINNPLPSPGYVVDVGGCGVEEVSLPEGVALDGGIVLRSGATIVKLRVIRSRCIDSVDET